LPIPAPDFPALCVDLDGTLVKSDTLVDSTLALARHRPAAKLATTVGALAASTEIFGWMTRHPKHALSRALALPGHELQHRLGTREPSPGQLEVAEAALRACLELEDGD